PTAEQSLIGKTLTPEVIANAARLAGATPTPIDDVRGKADYRTEMVRVLVSRTLKALAAKQERASWPHNPPMLWGENKAIIRQGLAERLDYEGQQTIRPIINGQPMVIPSGYDKTLLDFLREDVGLTGTKEGCAEGECGACTVFLDGA